MPAEPASANRQVSTAIYIAQLIADGEIQVEDAKLFERLRRLIVETARDPFGGIGRPEPLRGNLRGAWSRRVNDEHRLVYRVTNDQLIIMACRYHYDD